MSWSRGRGGAICELVGGKGEGAICEMVRGKGRCLSVCVTGS